MFQQERLKSDAVINISMRLQSTLYNDMFDSNLVSVPAKPKKILNRTRMIAVIN
jgi:hypothetical protein